MHGFTVNYLFHCFMIAATSLLLSCNDGSQAKLPPAKQGKLIREAKSFTMPIPPLVINVADLPGPTKIEAAGIPTKTIPAGKHYPMNNFRSKDGLAQDYVSALAIDKLGNLWIGSDTNGLTKYDGHSFTVLSVSDGLVNNIVQALYVDTLGRIWIGTYGGISRFDGGTFVNFTEKDGLPATNIQDITQDLQGRIWVATTKGVARLDGERFIVPLRDGLERETSSGLYCDHKGNLWVGTENGLKRFDGKTVTTFSKPEGFVSKSITGITQDNFDNLWIATMDGVFKYDGKSFTHFTAKDGLADNNVYSVFKDLEGHIWFGTTGGVTKHTNEGFINLRQGQGLAENFVQAFAQDQSLNMWIGTRGSGLIKFRGTEINNFTKDQGLNPSRVLSIFEDKYANLWLGRHGGGLVRYNGYEFTEFPDQLIPGQHRVTAMGKGLDDDFWIGTTEGPVKYDGKVFHVFGRSWGLETRIWRILESKSGALWFAANSTLAKFDGNSIMFYTSAQGIPDGAPQGLLEDSEGRIWLGKVGAGLTRIDKNQVTIFTEENGLPYNDVSTLVEDSNKNIWFGTMGGGLVRYDGSSFLVLSTADGLPHDAVFQLNQTRDGYLAVGTGKGLAILRGFKSTTYMPVQNGLSNAELEKLLPDIEVFNQQNDYPFAEVLYGRDSLYVDRNGAIWYGNGPSDLGLVHFDYDALKRREQRRKDVSQKVLIKNFKVANENVDLKETLELTYDLNNVAIEFVSIELDKPEAIVYQYQLEGYDDDWSLPTSKSSATFGNIDEGTYEFKVRARNPYGVWGEITSYKFVVLPPWYRTWWAYTLYAICSMALLFSVYRWRTAALRRRQQFLEMMYKAAERFVPRSFLNLIHKKHVQDVMLGDNTERTITVLFNDIRNFTTLVESKEPKDAFAFANRYWEYMAPIIRDFGGYIDQYQGDAILAIFPERPEDAIMCAVAMMQQLEPFNKRQKELNDTQISMGIGLSTGKAMLGVLGEKERYVAGLMGDVANTAARIEGLNKVYGTRILFSGETLVGLSTRRRLIRRADRVQLKGKKAATEVYEVIEWSDQLIDIGLSEYLVLFTKAQEKYFCGEFSQAMLGFNQCLKHYGNDPIVRLLNRRCEDFIKNGTPFAWDGTFKMTQK